MHLLCSHKAIISAIFNIKNVFPENLFVVYCGCQYDVWCIKMFKGRKTKKKKIHKMNCTNSNFEGEFILGKKRKTTTKMMRKTTILIFLCELKD